MLTPRNARPSKLSNTLLDVNYVKLHFNPIYFKLVKLLTHLLFVSKPIVFKLKKAGPDH